MVVGDRTPESTREAITTLSMYKNLTSNAPFMAFYDVKNAKMCNIYVVGGGLTHAEPVVDTDHFARFVNIVSPLMQPNRDIFWVLVGRTESNHDKIKQILNEQGLTWDTYFLCYNTTSMIKGGHWTRTGEVASSKNIENALCVYKNIRAKMPPTRDHVDKGSFVETEVIRQVPVLSHRHQAFVPLSVRETSLKSMAGVPLVCMEGQP